MTLQRSWVAVGACLLLAVGASAQTVRIKDIARISSQRENALVGYGLVTGLSGSGDNARNKATRVSLANVLNRFDLQINSDDIASRNVAVVMITASLPAYARPGDVIDVLVSSAGDARSLEGGTLLQAPLKGPDGRIYALAQGPLTVGGYRHDAQGNQVQRNHPTSGLISAGATVEAGADDREALATRTLSLVLSAADYNTAGRIAEGINTRFGAELAEVRDAASLDVRVPDSFARRVPVFVRQIEALTVEPDVRARVVINERTGIVVTGGDVRISPVSVAVGDIKITVTAQTAVSQPQLMVLPGNGVRTEVVTNSQLRVEERQPTFIPPGSTRVTDLVRLLQQAKTPTRDMISILQAIKAAGALHAELIVQ